LALSGAVISLLSGCASDQKSAVTAEEVRDGEALPPAPPAPASAATTPPPAAVAAGEPSDPAPTAEAPPAKGALSEAQIAKVTELINAAEVEQAKVAQRRAKAPDVKRFAELMITHHQQAQREQLRLVKQLKLTAADSTTAGKVKADGEAQLAKLKESDAAGFDAAYVTSQIEGHEQALELLDSQLIPNAKTPDVVSALQMARTVVDQHLREARALRK
jgi:putative membrane protein